MRGENKGKNMSEKKKEETPPLARRKLPHPTPKKVSVGNTSACAEKTTNLILIVSELKKHLRLRGENLNQFHQKEDLPETPPLARRKRQDWQCNNLFHRNTSACAEKTQ